MEPVTHTLVSVTLARAGLSRATRLAIPMSIAAGLVADVDGASAWLGSSVAYLTLYRGPTHSLLGTMALPALVALAFWLWQRNHPQNPLRLLPALVVCWSAAAAHLLLDCLNPLGVKPWWPFHDKAYAADVLEVVDPWIAVLLLLGLILPGLFRLITEEIGAKAERRGPQRGAIVALALVAAFCGARYALHERARAMLAGALYNGTAPLSVAAFPSAVSPLEWFGVVETENTLEELEVSLKPGAYFDPDRRRTVYKPEESDALNAARNTRAAQAFLKFARFPTARIERLPADMGAGYLVEIRDLRFSLLGAGRRGLQVVVEVDRQFKVREERVEFIGTASRF
jgi:inner membrane protein